MARKQLLEVHLAESARADLIAIWQWNASEHGAAYADKYLNYLHQNVQKLGRYPMLGFQVDVISGMRRLLIKRRSAGHWHIAFYRIAGDRIVVIHFFHTAQDSQGRIQKEP